MTLKEAVNKNLATLPAFDSGERLLEAEAQPLRAACKLVALDGIGCAFLSVTVSHESEVAWDVARLKQAAGQLAARLTYLLEPISPIEVDAEGCTVQMRSSPPQKDDDGTSYYELLLTRAGALSLHRYRRTTGAAAAARQPIEAHVTREVLLRLIGDFAATLS